MPPAKTALLVIDVQCGILAIPDTACGRETAESLDKTIMRIAGLIERARTASVPVIYIQHDGGPGDRLEPETSGWPIRSEIAPNPDERVIHKRACDAFFETTLNAELGAANITQLVVCGCMTPYCIDTTVRRAVGLGYDVVLAADGHATEDTKTLRAEQIVAHHNAILDGFDAGEHKVRVCPSSDILLV
jgi:nicotinamidase-related amidase